ncbi:ATP-dependent dethiobiotin synthetase BioD [Mycobacterium xenopi 3993]|nr:ATP-dependent dethiobiotin synthetase BioD [Mycobacterium xenopi 3993]
MTILIVTGTDTGWARRSPPRHWPAMRGKPEPTWRCANQCRPAPTPATTTSPSWPAVRGHPAGRVGALPAAAGAGSRCLPRRHEPALPHRPTGPGPRRRPPDTVDPGRRRGRTAGAAGPKRCHVARPRRRPRRGGAAGDPLRAGHPQPHRADIGSSCSARCSVRRTGNWQLAGRPATVHVSNRCVLAKLAPVRAVLPASAGTMDAADFAAMSARAFDRDWVSALVG